MKDKKQRIQLVNPVREDLPLSSRSVPRNVYDLKYQLYIEIEIKLRGENTPLWGFPPKSKG